MRNRIDPRESTQKTVFCEFGGSIRFADQAKNANLSALRSVTSPPEDRVATLDHVVIRSSEPAPRSRCTSESWAFGSGSIARLALAACCSESVASG
jgi:hypothetical protein